MRARWAIAGVAALAAAAGAVTLSRASSLPAAQAAVVLTADVRGYLESCGCSEHMLGGIDRVAAQVEQARKELGQAVHVGAGDALFNGPPADPAHAQQDNLKAKTLLKAFADMQTAALALGPRDLPMAPPLVSDVKPPFPVLGAGKLPGFAIDHSTGIALGLASGNNPEVLAKNVEGAKSAGAELVLALAEFPLKDLLPATPALQKAGADLAVVGHQAVDVEGENDRVVESSLPVLTLMNRGRAVARVDLHRVAGAPAGFVPVTSTEEQAHELQLRDAEIESLKKRAHLATGPLKDAMDKKIAEKQAQRDALSSQKPAPPQGRSWFSIQFVQLSDDKPHSPTVKQLIEQFTADVGALNLAWAKAHGQDCPAAKPGEAAFVGTKACIACHADPGDVWEKTGHAHAYPTLVKVNKQYDLDCVRCHVVGTNAPGGVCRVDKVKGMENVGCESCHGRGSLHADDPKKVKMPVSSPGEQNCRVCHTPENSTAFDYAVYLPKILGPGHGKPLPKPQ